MKIIRYLSAKKVPTYGWVLNNQVGAIEGDIFSEYRRLDATTPMERLTLLSPVMPGKVICVARNYVEHAREHDAEVPEIPMIFLKPPSSVIGNGGVIQLPPQSEQVEHEAELAVVIGRTGRWIDPSLASGYVFGYTIGNDVTARDLQRKDGQWTRAKGFDTFCPLGPWIDTDIDPSDLLITCRVNGEMRQMESTKEMFFSIPQVVAFISNVMTLEPGDVILTGTPAGVGRLESGDQVEIGIEGIGILKNPVKKLT